MNNTLRRINNKICPASPVISLRPLRFALFLLFSLTTTVFAQERDIAITVYTSGLGLIRDTRSIELEKGRHEVNLSEVATEIDRTTVQISSLTDPENVVVLEQRYAYDLQNTDDILWKYINRNITLHLSGSDIPIQGQLISLKGDVTLSEENGAIHIIKRNAIQRYSVDPLPDELVTSPTLKWLVENTGDAGTHRLEASYLTGGMSWQADYTAVANQEETEIVLSGWASINNQSGAYYGDASLTLVAGDVNRVQQPRKEAVYRAASFAGRGGSADQQFQQQQISEYHSYTLDRRATLENFRTTQLMLLPETNVKVTKHYVYDGGQQPAGVQTRLRLENRERFGLGMPIPLGNVRMYKTDKKEKAQFIGEDRIRNLAKDETVYLTVGRAFDIIGERKPTNTRQLSNRSREESYQITLRNHGNEDVKVKVVEHLNNAPNWFIRESASAYEKIDARTIEFDVSVPKDGEAEVTYTVVYRW